MLIVTEIKAMFTVQVNTAASQKSGDHECVNEISWQPHLVVIVDVSLWNTVLDQKTNARNTAAISGSTLLAWLKKSPL